jgi:hypothetical protein
VRYEAKHLGTWTGAQTATPKNQVGADNNFGDSWHEGKYIFVRQQDCRDSTLGKRFSHLMSLNK